MSPRAAWQLEELGFTDVYDYAPGKIDWFANGLPREGMAAGVSWVGDVAVSEDFATGTAQDELGTLRDRVEGGGYDFCIVLNDRRIVLGVLRGDALGKDPSLPAADVMELGPRTTRPNKPVEALLGARSSQGVKNWIVTTSHGLLLGVLARADAERALEQTRAEGGA